MNYFYNEFQAKEKLRGLREEGIRSQAFSREGTPGRAAGRMRARIAVVVTAVLGLILIWVR